LAAPPCPQFAEAVPSAFGIQHVQPAVCAFRVEEKMKEEIVRRLKVNNKADSLFIQSMFNLIM
jgi:hypothetical protein